MKQKRENNGKILSLSRAKNHLSTCIQIERNERMKKIKPLILLSLIFAQILSINAMAAGNADNADIEPSVSYNVEELKATLRGAFDLYIGFFSCSRDFEDDDKSDLVTFYPDPYPELGRPYQYAVRADKYRKWADFVAALDKYYSEDAKALFLRKVESTEKDGLTYSCIVLAYAQGPYYYIDGVPFYGELVESKLEDSFKIISATPEKITASFTLHETLSGDPTDCTAEFLYENGGWRLSKGAFIDECEACIADNPDSPFYAPSSSPITGDGTIFLTAAAAVSLVIIMRSRRARRAL